MQEDNIEQMSTEAVKEVIAQTIAQAGLDNKDVTADAHDDTNAEMDAYMAAFDKIASLQQFCAKARDDILNTPGLTSADRHLMTLIRLQGELIDAMATQMVCMNNIFG